MLKYIDKKINMQFKVPQDVQREDTIIGPITIKQLIILGIGGGIAYAIYVGLAASYYMEIWLPPVIIVGGLTLAFAFLKIHEMPFHIFLMNFIEYHLLPRQRIWIQGTGYPFIPPFEEPKKKQETHEEIKKKPIKSIAELTKVLDTHGEISHQEKKEGLKQIIEQNYKN